MFAIKDQRHSKNKNSMNIDAETNSRIAVIDYPVFSL